MKQRRTRIFWRISLITVALAAVAIVFWVRSFHHYLPQRLLRDIRAGLVARDLPDPDARVNAFLSARYGPLTEPRNRQQAFLDFFDIDHIRGLHFIVSHTPLTQKVANTRAMAQWIANYRTALTPEERVALQTRLNSQSGQAMLRRATAEFQTQDVYYRGEQKAVVQELMVTLADLRQH